jgi:hypothetical protein
VGLIRGQARIYMGSMSLPLAKIAPSMDVSTECIQSSVSFGVRVVRVIVYSGSPSIGDAEDMSG